MKAYSTGLWAIVLSGFLVMFVMGVFQAKQEQNAMLQRKAAMRDSAVLLADNVVQ